MDTLTDTTDMRGSCKKRKTKKVGRLMQYQTANSRLARAGHGMTQVVSRGLQFLSSIKTLLQSCESTTSFC